MNGLVKIQPQTVERAPQGLYLLEFVSCRSFYAETSAKSRFYARDHQSELPKIVACQTSVCNFTDVVILCTGPFPTHLEFIASLHKEAKKLRGKKK